MSVGPRDIGYGVDDDELDTASKWVAEGAALFFFFRYKQGC